MTIEVQTVIYLRERIEVLTVQRNEARTTAAREGLQAAIEELEGCVTKIVGTPPAPVTPVAGGGLYASKPNAGDSDGRPSGAEMFGDAAFSPDSKSHGGEQ